MAADGGQEMADGKIFIHKNLAFYFKFLFLFSFNYSLFYILFFYPHCTIRHFLSAIRHPPPSGMRLTETGLNAYSQLSL